MVTYTDTFNRADSAAGSGFGLFSDASKTWAMTSGTGHIASNKAVFETSDDLSPFATVDVGEPDFYVIASPTSLGGEGLYFRVVDSDNWWRLFLYRGTVQTLTGQHYSCFYGAYRQYHTHTYSSSSPCAASIFHDHNGSGGHEHLLTSSTLVNDYRTDRADRVRLERCTAGTPATIASVVRGTASSLAVLTSGNSIECYVDGTLVASSISSSHGTATRVGIGLGPSMEAGASGFDSFAATPANVAGAIVADYPIDGAVTHALRPLLGVALTDPDPAQTLTTTWEVDNDIGFGSLIDTGTVAVASPAASVGVSRLVGSDLAIDTLYYWRAKVNDGGGDSAWTTTRSFYVNRTPVATNEIEPGRLVPTGLTTLTHGFSDPDGDSQAELQIIRVHEGDTTYWTGTAWSEVETSIEDAALSHEVSFADLSGEHDISFTVTDGFGSTSSETATETVTVHDLPIVSLVRPPADSELRLLDPILEVAWVYSQAQDVAQASYRLRVTDIDEVTVYADTGWSGSAGTTHSFDMESEGIPLAGPVILLLDVRSEDGVDFEASDTTDFSVLVESFRPPFVINLGIGANQPNRAEHFGIREGDDLPMLAATIRDRNQDPLDLVDVTAVVFRMRTATTRTLLVEGTASVDNASAGLLRYAWQEGDTDRPGSHRVEFELTFASGAVMTLPNAEHDGLYVDVQEHL